MIVDSFLFGWELDILEMRLIEMDPFVDIFVLIESDQTFQGEKKPLYFQENASRFTKWIDKIHVIHAVLPNTNNPWEREYASRECFKHFMQNLSSNDILIHGDVDEIMSRNLGFNLDLFLERNKIYSLNQTQYSMAIDWMYPDLWQGTVFARCESVKNMSVLSVRDHRIYGSRVRDGWHFTWLGGKEFINKKASAFSHTEDEIQNYIKDMGHRLYTEGYHVRGEKLIPVDVDDSYPEFIRSGNYPVVWNRLR